MALRAIGRACLVIASLLAMPGTTLAAEPAVPCFAPLRAGVSQLGVAYFKPRGGVAQGYDLELVRELARRLGCSFEIIEMNRVRIFQSLEHGEFIDLGTSASQTPERDVFAQFVPLALTRNYLLVHKSRLAQQPGFDLNQFVASPGLRMGVLAGSNYGSFINARLAVLGAQGRTDSAAQVELLIPRLIAGRYDGLVVTPAYYIAALRELPGGEDLRAVPIPESDAYEAGFYLSRKTLSATRRSSIREALHAMHGDGTLLRIYRRYFPEALARERVSFSGEAK